MDRQARLHQYLNRDINTTTPLDEHIYAKRVIPLESMTPVEKEPGPDLQDILERLHLLEEMRQDRMQEEPPPPSVIEPEKNENSVDSGIQSGVE
jgi:hypothetical protein